MKEMNATVPGERMPADMSAGLRRLGFELTTELDANRVEKRCAGFTRRSTGGGGLADLLRGATERQSRNPFSSRLGQLAEG